MVEYVESADLPPQRIDVRDLAGMQYYDVESIEVFEFHEQEQGKGRPSQVHAVLQLAGGDAPFVMRFKSEATLDQFIGALMRHRQGVWGRKKGGFNR